MKEHEGDNRNQCARMYAYFCVDAAEEQDHCAEIAREYAVPRERTYIDIYGAAEERTEYEKLRTALSRGDTLVIERLDHLGDTLEDIAAAKARGVKFGRPRRKRPKDFEKVKEQRKSGLLSSRTAAKELGVSQSSFVRWAKEEQ